MYSGQCRLLQGENRTEVATGEYWLDTASADVRRGYVQCVAPLGFRFESTEGLVLEFDRMRFDLHGVKTVNLIDWSADDLEYHRRRGEPRTEFKLKFDQAVKQRNWRSSLAAYGVP